MLLFLLTCTLVSLNAQVVIVENNVPKATHRFCRCRTPAGQ